MQDNRIVPVECKANVHVRAKSLETFRKKYEIGESIRVSAKNFGMDNGIKSVPLYAAELYRLLHKLLAGFEQ